MSVRFLFFLLLFISTPLTYGAGPLAQLCMKAWEAMEAPQSTQPRRLLLRHLDLNSLLAEYREKNLSLKQLMDGFKKMLDSVQVASDVVKNGQEWEVKILPMEGAATDLNQTAWMLKEAFGTDLVIGVSERPIASFSPMFNRITLSPRIITEGSLDESVFHEAVHAYHHHLAETRGPNLFSVELRNDSNAKNYQHTLTTGELGAYAASIRLNTIRLDRAWATDAVRAARRDELLKTATQARELAERIRNEMNEVAKYLKGKDKTGVSIKAEAFSAMKPTGSEPVERVANIRFRLPGHPDIHIKVYSPEMQPLFSKFRKTHPWETEHGEIESQLLEMARPHLEQRINELVQLSDNLILDYREIANILGENQDSVVTPALTQKLFKLGRQVNNRITSLQLAP